MAQQVDIEVQVATRSRNVPSSAELKRWAEDTLVFLGRFGVVTLRLVDRAEAVRLNETYRGALGKSGPTNVLSFPYEHPEDLPPELDVGLLGDVVLCAPVITAQARDQAKSLGAHWAHLVVHGTLHLLGFDHEDEKSAEQMEALETELLGCYGIPDPYQPRVAGRREGEAPRRG